MAEDSRQIRALLLYWGRRGFGPQFTMSLARAMRDDGRLRLACSMSRNAMNYPQYAGLGVPCCDVSTFNSSAGFLAGFLSLPLVVRRLARFMDQQSCQVICSTMLHAWEPLVIPFLRRRAAYVLCVHDWHAHPGDRLSEKMMPLLRRMVRRADGLITLSDHVRRQVLESGGVPEHRVLTIPIGALCIGADIPAPRTRPRPNPRLLFFGRILEYKGVGLLLDAFAILKERIPGINLQIAGTGDMAPYAGQLATLRDVSVVNEYVPDDRLPSLMQSSDLVVLPYIESTQCGVIPIAQAYGVPVVCTKVGGMIEQVDFGRSGFVSGGVDAISFAAAVEGALKDQAKYASVAAEGKKTIFGERSWARTADKLYGFFSGLIDERRMDR